MRVFLKSVARTGIQVVAPDVCAGCGVAGAWICAECERLVVPVDPDTCCQRCGWATTSDGRWCHRCRDWPDNVLRVRSRFEFAGPVRDSILRMKYRGEYARTTWHAEHLQTLIVDSGWDIPDVVMPIPLHRRKLRSRGYNQSEKLARYLARRLNVPVEEYLIRIKETQSQTSLSGEERRRNVAGAFACNLAIAGTDVLLVDDVVTTGATMLECASACIDAGASRVRGISIATGT